jgi:hypothetical protein
MRRRKLARVALVMKPDVSFNPIDIGFFSADALVAESDTALLRVGPQQTLLQKSALIVICGMTGRTSMNEASNLPFVRARCARRTAPR